MIENAGTPEAATEVLVEWGASGGGNVIYRITCVGGILRLEVSANGHGANGRHWLMCVPEGREAFDGLITGLAKMHKRVRGQTDLNAKLARALIRAANALQDPGFKAQILEELPAMAEIVRAA